MPKYHGFTLIELMVTLAILAIVMGIALPAMQDFLLNARLTSAANDFVASVNVARGEAIKRRSPITVTPQAGGWQDGWQVLSGAEVVAEFEGTDTLTANNVGGITFTAQGTLQTLNPWAGNNLLFCDSRQKGRAITLSGAGTVSVAKVDSGCVTGGS